MADRILHLPPGPGFATLIEPARDKWAGEGRGSGKSHFFAELLIADAMAPPGENGSEGCARCAYAR